MLNNMTTYDVGAIFAGMMYILGLFNDNNALVFLGFFLIMCGLYFQYTCNPFGTNVMMFGVGVFIMFFYQYHYKPICK